MSKYDDIFEHFCAAQASFESSRQLYRREYEPGQVRSFFNASFNTFELRRYMMNFYFTKGSFTISDLLKVSKFSRPTVNSTVYEALNLGYLEEVSGINDRRRNDFRPTKPMLESWNNYCNALLVNPEFSNLLKLAQTLILAREFEANLSENNM